MFLSSQTQKDLLLFFSYLRNTGGEMNFKYAVTFLMLLSVAFLQYGAGEHMSAHSVDGVEIAAHNHGADHKPEHDKDGCVLCMIIAMTNGADLPQDTAVSQPIFNVLSAVFDVDETSDVAKYIQAGQTRGPPSFYS